MKYSKKTVIIGLFLLACISIGIALAANSDTSEGSFQIDSEPSISGVDFQTDAYVTTPTLTPDGSTYFRVNYTATHSATFDDILNCTLYIYDDSTHGADYDSASPDGIFLTVFQWIEATDVWSVTSQGSMSQWTVDTSGSDDPGAASSETQFEFSMRFQISPVARYDTDWNVSVHIFDDDDDEGYDAESALVTMNQQFDLSFSAAYFTWGSQIQDNSVNNSITPDTLAVTVYANDNWELKIKATDFTDNNGNPDVDIDLNNIIAQDNDGTQGGASLWIRSTDTIGKGDWDDQSPMSTESGLSRDVHIFLSPGVLFAGGVEWNTTVTITVQANS